MTNIKEHSGEICQTSRAHALRSEYIIIQPMETKFVNCPQTRLFFKTSHRHFLYTRWQILVGKCTVLQSIFYKQRQKHPKQTKADGVARWMKNKECLSLAVNLLWFLVVFFAFVCSMKTLDHFKQSIPQTICPVTACHKTPLHLFYASSACCILITVQDS